MCLNPFFRVKNLIITLSLYGFIPALLPLIPVSFPSWIRISEAQAAIALVQTATGRTDGGTTVTATFGAAPTANNLLVAIAGNRNSSAAPTTPAGWSIAISETANTPGQVIYYKIAGAAEPSAVTVGGYGVSTRLGLHIYEYSGINTAAPFIAAASSSGTGTAPFSATVNTTGSLNLVITGMIGNANTAYSLWTGGFIEKNDFSNLGAAGSRSTYGGADQVVSVPGVYSTIATIGVSVAWRVQIVNFNGNPSLPIFKQVWDSAGTNCLASIPADAACNAGATTITVPAGTQVTFLIFVRNTMAAPVTNMVFQDLLDDSAAGFTYVAASLKRTPNDGTAPSDVAALATIMAAAATAQTDALGGPDDFMSITDSDADTLLDKLTVGAVAGQANTSLGFPANKTFGVLFKASKN